MNNKKRVVDPQSVHLSIEEMRTPHPTSTKHIEAKIGDLVEQDLDAIVNASNASLQLGGGVAGAIRRKDPAVQAACNEIGPIQTGGAAITDTPTLGKVIHAVGPIWDGKEHCIKELYQAYWSALTLAQEHGIKRIAFPFLSAGIFGFPVKEGAATIPLRAVQDYSHTFDLIRFVALEKNDVYKKFRSLIL